MANNSRLEQRKPLIEAEVTTLKKQIKKFEKVSWAFVILGFLAMLSAFKLHYDYTLNDYNELGSFIGGLVGSIWSLAGLFFVYVAFLGQKQSILNQELELLYNQAELIATREELKGQKQQMIEQNKTLKQQQFENTFFKLFDRYIKNLDDLQEQNNEGLDVLNAIYDNFQHTYMNDSYIYKQDYKGKTELETARMIFSSTLNNHSKNTRPIFVDFVQLLDCINQFCKVNPKYYINLIMSQLSNKAVCLIAYQGLLIDKKKMGSLTIKYSIVNYIYTNSPIDIHFFSTLKNE